MSPKGSKIQRNIVFGIKKNCGLIDFKEIIFVVLNYDKRCVDLIKEN